MEILCNPRSRGDLEEGGRTRIELLVMKENSAREAHNVVRLRQPVALVLEVIWISPLCRIGRVDRHYSRPRGPRPARETGL